MLQLDFEPCWIDLLIGYVHDGTLLADRKEARKLRHGLTICYLRRQAIQEIFLLAIVEVLVFFRGRICFTRSP